MSRNAPEEIARRLLPGHGAVNVHAVASGQVNRCSRVTRDGRAYSLRIAAPETLDLGLDREWECRVLAAAAAAGLAPRIECCLPAEGVVIADWVVGRSWSCAEALLPDNIDLMAGLLRRVHALPIPRPARAMSVCAWIQLYAAAAVRRDISSLPQVVELRAAAARHLRALTALGAPDAVVCHSDLHRLNLVIAERAVLLDWEYAHVGDGFWDLAGWVANNDWSVATAAQLLQGYLGRPGSEVELARLKLLVWLYDYVCLLWSELYLNQRIGADHRAIFERAECLGKRLRVVG